MGYETIIRMANPSLNRDLLQHGVSDLLDEDLRKALDQAMEEERRVNAVAAAQEILALSRQAMDALKVEVEKLREIRREERQVLGRINAINEAKQYATETRNFLPLMNKLGKLSPQQLFELRRDGVSVEVPEDWVASEKPSAPKGKKK